MSTLRRAIAFAARHDARAVLARLRDELRWPTTKLGQNLNGPLRSLGSLVGRIGAGLSGSRMPAERDGLTAFYDLGVQPATFDTTWFVCAAEQARIRAGLATLTFVIVPPDRSAGVESDAYEAVIGRQAQAQRITDLIVPVFRMVDGARGLVLAPSRAYASSLVARAGDRVFPSGYLTSMPVAPARHPEIANSVVPAAMDADRDGHALAHLRPPEHMLLRARSWLRLHSDRRPCVTITMRDYGYDPARNGSKPDWTRLAAALIERGCAVVTIPDTEAPPSNDPILGAGTRDCPEASWNVSFRAALYEAADLNLGTQSGPMGLCFLNPRTRYIVFKMIVDGVAGSSVEHQEKFGYRFGESFPFARGIQRLIWEPDRFEIMWPHVQAALAQLKESDRGPDADAR